MNRADGPPTGVLHPCMACRARNLTVCQVIRDAQIDVVDRVKIDDRSYEKGEHLFHQGERANAIYNLVDGWVALYHLLSDGRRQILEILLPGAFIGYQPDLAAPMTHSAQCLTPVSICAFSREKFPDLLREYPELALRMIQMCAHDHVITHEHLTDLGRRTALERTAHLLLEFFFRLEDRGLADESGAVSVPLAQDELADVLGLSRVRINRMLQELRERGLVDIGRRSLRVRGPLALAELAGLPPGLLGDEGD